MCDPKERIESVIRALDPFITRKVEAEMLLMEIYETCVDDEIVSKVESYLKEKEMI